jgi:hypothetical protein
MFIQPLPSKYWKVDTHAGTQTEIIDKCAFISEKYGKQAKVRKPHKIHDVVLSSGTDS